MDNIKMNLLEIGVSVVDWIGLAQDRYRWRAFVNSVMSKPRFRCRCGLLEILTCFKSPSINIAVEVGSCWRHKRTIRIK
jgi:hypothetical protein